MRAATSKLENHNMIKTRAITTIISTLLFVTSTSSLAQTIGDAGKKDITTITPEKKAPKINSAKIDTERFELGVYTGFLSIENFDVNALIGLQGTFHINSRLMANVYYGQSDGARARFEREVGDDSDFIANREDGFRYIAAGISYNLLNARSFSGSKRKYDSYISIDTAVESVDFAGETNIGLMIGTTYKTVVTDWFTVNINLKDHIVEREFLGESSLTQNLELSLGLNFLF